MMQRRAASATTARSIPPRSNIITTNNNNNSRTSHPSSSPNYIASKRTCLVLSPLILLLILWIYSTFQFLSVVVVVEPFSIRGAIISNGKNGTKRGDGEGRLVDILRRKFPTVATKKLLVGRSEHELPAVKMNDGVEPTENETNQHQQQQSSKTTQQKIVLISRNPKVVITSSARGNLGPPSVLNQNPPGTDWLKDRWQAASDMHGTAIAGSHWIEMDFTGVLNGKGTTGAIYVTKVVLDWETAFAKDYRIEGRIDRPTNGEGAGADEGWCVLYDGSLDNVNANTNNVRGGIGKNKERSYPHRHEEEYGQSPGVKEKLPLHIIHTIDWTTTDAADDVDESSQKCLTLRYLRLLVKKSAHPGWGVSLWEVDVYGRHDVVS
ncbi:predicted protein [Thalassiosira pseudonana CCMP1335]|uniref:F5/8 type C domain-containing protein n=1 Tax=Thalassiosira pseudonana TaxID=35128 RepID=B8LCL1_THAPS|nr:predicted protein [Thalassiosira pseudonana CCMP1335]EED87003.1 predicted protein [Thalassiosira pseudonana CCMP1335]